MSMAGKPSTDDDGGDRTCMDTRYIPVSDLELEAAAGKPMCAKDDWLPRHRRLGRM